MGSTSEACLHVYILTAISDAKHYNYALLICSKMTDFVCCTANYCRLHENIRNICFSWFYLQN